MRNAFMILMRLRFLCVREYTRTEYRTLLFFGVENKAAMYLTSIESNRVAISSRDACHTTTMTQ